MARQPIAGYGLAGVNGEDAALQVAQFGEHKLGQLGSRKNGPRLTKEQRAGFRQLDAAADPVEKFCAMPSFQRRDRGARGRLSNVERFGGARDVLAFCHGDKDTELFKRHKSTLSGDRRRRLDQDGHEVVRRVLFVNRHAPDKPPRSARQGREIVDDGRDVRRIDWRLVRIPHFLDLGLPRDPRQTWLRQNHAGGMAGETVVVDDVGPQAFKPAIPVREVHVDRSQRYAARADGGWRWRLLLAAATGGRPPCRRKGPMAKRTVPAAIATP